MRKLIENLQTILILICICFYKNGFYLLIGCKGKDCDYINNGFVNFFLIKLLLPVLKIKL
jgi:hypothetical protein